MFLSWSPFSFGGFDLHKSNLNQRFNLENSFSTFLPSKHCVSFKIVSIPIPSHPLARIFKCMGPGFGGRQILPNTLRLGWVSDGDIWYKFHQMLMHKFTYCCKRNKTRNHTKILQAVKKKSLVVGPYTIKIPQIIMQNFASLRKTSRTPAKLYQLSKNLLCLDS